MNALLAMQIAWELRDRGADPHIYQHEARGPGGALMIVDNEVQSAHSYSQTVRPAIRDINSGGFDGVVELHFNSVPRLNNDGLRMRDWDTCFAYHQPSSRVAERLGRACSAACAEVLGARDRGSIPQDQTWSGAPLLIVRECKPPTILLESHNGQNPKQHAAFRDALLTPRLGPALAVAILTALETT